MVELIIFLTNSEYWFATIWDNCKMTNTISVSPDYRTCKDPETLVCLKKQLISIRKNFFFLMFNNRIDNLRTQYLPCKLRKLGFKFFTCRSVPRRKFLEKYSFLTTFVFYLLYLKTVWSVLKSRFIFIKNVDVMYNTLLRDMFYVNKMIYKIT